MNNRNILWEKWRDPLGHDADDSEWPGAYGNFATDKIIQAATSQVGLDEDDEEVYGESDKEFKQEDIDAAIQEHQRQQSIDQKGVPMIATPMGLIPMTEHTRAGNLFNFWTAHTNFPCTTEVKNTIDNTAGVETLDIFTRYRWRISIGKAFDSVQVKKELAKALGAEPMKRSNNDNEKKS